jgi:hypothetical protein
MDNIEASTRAVNGGLNGLEVRRAYLKAAKKIFGIVPTVPKIDAAAVAAHPDTVAVKKDWLLDHISNLTAILQSHVDNLKPPPPDPPPVTKETKP